MQIHILSIYKELFVIFKHITRLYLECRNIYDQKNVSYVLPLSTQYPFSTQLLLIISMLHKLW